MRIKRASVSDAKHRAVRAAVDRQVTRGQTASAAAVARAADVTESFLYRHEASPCRLCLDHFGAGPVSYHRQQMQLIIEAADGRAEQDARASVASLRADLANAKATNQRLRKQVAALERRLGQTFGAGHQHEIQAALGTLHDPEQLAQLESEVRRLTRLCAEKDEELTAVRRINAELTREHNRN